MISLILLYNKFTTLIRGGQPDSTPPSRGGGAKLRSAILKKKKIFIYFYINYI